MNAANLVSSWIPALEGVEAKLNKGALVADVGCGHGASTILMARAYPNSRFIGFDYHGPSIEWARKAAEAAGVGGSTSFEVAPAKEYPGRDYDLVAMFDCLHDMGDPSGAAAHVRESLRPDGTFYADLHPLLQGTGDRLGTRCASRGGAIARDCRRRGIQPIPPRYANPVQPDPGSQTLEKRPRFSL